MEEKKIIISGHEAVDLGLSVKWATCNIGASRPEEYGDYFAWVKQSQKTSIHMKTICFIMLQMGVILLLIQEQ